MAEISGNLGSLIQGVSQQPAIQRLEGQCEIQENFFSSPIDGLNRRRPTEFISNLTTDNEYTFKYYNAGSLGNYIIAYTTGDIKVFDLLGNEFVVTKTNASYITNDKLEFIGIDDSIYCVNTNKITAMLPDTRTYIEDGVIVFLLGGQYGRKHEISLSWTDGSGSNKETVFYKSPDGSVSEHVDKIATTNIATELKLALEANVNINSDFTITREADVLFIKAKTGAGVTAYSATVDDGEGGTNMFVVNNRANDVGKLPKYAPQGYIVTITESGTSSKDDWYLEFIIPEDANGDAPAIGDGFGLNGYWAETIAPNIPYRIDNTTMPHVLKKTGANTFTFSPAEWEDRTTGNEETNPVPSFIGKSISDLSDFQERLVFISDVSVIMSRTTKYTNFFRQSSTVLADDDPIDVSSAAGVFKLEKGIKHNRDFIIFGNNAQFIIFGRNAITPQNTSIVLTTEFETNLNARPVGAGANIFFCFNYGNFVGISEYYVEGTSDINNSREITQNVNQYLKGKPLELTSSTNFKKLIIRTDQNLKELGFYEYIWLDNKKVQSSWSKLVYHEDVVSTFFQGSILYLITKVNTTYKLLSLDLDNAPDLGLPYKVHLDEKIVRTGVNTTFTIPYSIDDIDNYVAVQGEGCPNVGLTANIENITGNLITLSSDVNEGTIYFGRKYTSKYVPTNPYIKDNNKNKIGNVLHKIKHFVLTFVSTGNLICNVSDPYGYSQDYKFIGRYVSAATNIVGQPALEAGTLRVPFRKDISAGKLTITSTSHLPLGIINIDWVGDYRTRSRHRGN